MTADSSSDQKTARETSELIRFGFATPSSEIPATVLHESKRCLLDFVGLAIGAAHHPAVEAARSAFDTMGGDGHAHSLGTPVKLRVTDAAMVSGVAAHVLDFDDTHAATILHPTTPLYAAGMASAEWRHRSGLDLLAAHALGYEVGARVSLALYPEHYDVGWHMTGTTGGLAAAVSSGRLLQLDQRQARHCLGIAATRASGHREHFGTMTKSFHAGHAAADGVLAALLAGRGFTSAPNPLQGRRGMFSVMSTKAKPEALVDGLGERWEIFRNAVKPYPCGVVIHPAIDAVRQLRERMDVPAEEIENLELRVHPLVVELTGKTDPRTGLEGKFSAPFACAIAFLEGKVGVQHFTDAHVTRDDVRAVMTRITLVPDPDLTHDQAVATIRCTRGSESIRVEHARGTPENRLSDDEIWQKFEDLVVPTLGQRQAGELADRVWQLEAAESVSELALATVPSR